MALSAGQRTDNRHGTSLSPGERQAAVARVRRRVATAADRHDLIRRGEKVLLACSGGPDSTAMLDCLAYLGATRGWRLHVCHVDHQLRPGGDDEAKLVGDQAAAHGLGFTALQVEVARVGSLQDAARQVRHCALRHLAASLDCGAIALGHTADDQAETVLMRVFGGATPRALQAMGQRDGVLVRPLLRLWHEDILAYCRALGLAYIEDPSNRDPRFLRSRIRHELLPELEKVFPGAKKRLIALAQGQRDAGSNLTPC